MRPNNQDQFSNKRTFHYFRQVKLSLLFKIVAIGATFLTVPITINWLGQESYGVWSTILSIVSWIVFFDFGIGNGLKTQLAKAVALNDFGEAKEVISSAYTYIGLVTLFLLVISVIIFYTLPWTKVLNSSNFINGNLQLIVLVTSIFVIVNFWLGLINSILYAINKGSAVVFGQLINATLSFLVVCYLSNLGYVSLFYLAIGYGFSLIIPSLLISFWFFRTYRHLIPSFSLHSIENKRQLLLGFQFFVLQLAVIVIFTTDKIIISHFFGPAMVAQYDVVFKYFTLLTLGYSLISAPLSSAYAEAFHRYDFPWIRYMLRQQINIFFGFSIIVFLMILAAKKLIQFWISPMMHVSNDLVIAMGFYILISIWVNIFATFVNSIGKLKLQLYCLVVAMFINIPLAWLLVKHFGFGLEGVVYASTLSLLLFSIVGPMQSFYLAKKIT